jgi:hypothetical protein
MGLVISPPAAVIAAYALKRKLLKQWICFAGFFGSNAMMQSADIRKRIRFGMVIARKFPLILPSLVN